MDLRRIADEAEDVAVGLSTFRTPLPEYATDITATISDYYAIIASLTHLNDLSQDAQYRPDWPNVRADLELLRASLTYTDEDILDFFRCLDGANAPPERFRQVWVAMNQFFWDEAKYSLATRLAKYKTFLHELGDMMKT